MEHAARAARMEQMAHTDAGVAPAARQATTWQAAPGGGAASPVAAVPAAVSAFDALDGDDEAARAAIVAVLVQVDALW